MYDRLAAWEQSGGGLPGPGGRKEPRSGTYLSQEGETAELRGPGEMNAEEGMLEVSSNRAGHCPAATLSPTGPEMS